MSFAWETTEEDIRIVLERMGEPTDDETVDFVMCNIDCYKVEDAALRGGTDMLDQTKAAQCEIEEQIFNIL
jgi:hypothetical protein